MIAWVFRATRIFTCQAILPHFANKILLFLHLSQISPNYLNSSPKSPQIRCSAPILRPHPSSTKIFLALSTSLQTHTITHPPIGVTKILSDSHSSTHVGFAHTLANSTGFERSSWLLEFLGKFIVGFAHYKNFSGRICTLPKIVGFAHTCPHVTPVEQCRICTKAQGNCPALNENKNKNHSHLKSGMRMIIIRI